MCLWINRRTVTGHETYPETMEALNNALANVTGDWTAEVVVATDDDEKLYFMASNREREPNEIEWEDGLSVIVVVRYDGEDGETEDVFELMVTFQREDGVDHEKELEIIAAMLYAWVEEKSFPNARMAINVRSLLSVKEVQDYLKESNFPAYIRSRNYRPRY